MKKKLLIFHSALAPYRINFFNKLSEEFSATIIYAIRTSIERTY